MDELTKLRDKWLNSIPQHSVNMALKLLILNNGKVDKNLMIAICQLAIGEPGSEIRKNSNEFIKEDSLDFISQEK